MLPRVYTQYIFSLYSVYTVLLYILWISFNFRCSNNKIMFIVDVLSFSSCHVILCCSREFVPKTIIISPVSYHDDPWMNVIHFILLIYNLSICYLNGMKQPTCFWPKKTHTQVLLIQFLLEFCQFTDSI